MISKSCQYYYVPKQINRLFDKALLLDPGAGTIPAGSLPN
jgi:hypothetical protein